MRGSAGLPLRETGSKESVQDSVGIDNAIRREQNTDGFQHSESAREVQVQNAEFIKTRCLSAGADRAGRRGKG